MDHHPKHWLTLLLVVAATVVFFASSDRGSVANTVLNEVFDTVGLGGGMQIQSTEPVVAVFPMAGVVNSADYSQSSGLVPQYSGAAPAAKDSREFLKKSYAAEMKTRSVQTMVRRAETTIRGFGGRVDQTTSSEKRGYITFVIPAAKFETFRDEVESFVDSRFLSVNTTGVNLLSQKQGIEVAQKSAEEQLADLQAERQKMVKDHNSTVASLNAQITDADTERRALEGLDQAPQILQRITDLQATLSSLRSRLSNENYSYTQTLASIDARIKYANQNLTAVEESDKEFVENIETVNGSLTFTWISWWGIVQTYIPAYVIAGILLLLALISYVWERRSGKMIATKTR